jgi:tetratricopeptide (TPR) repeat protein
MQKFLLLLLLCFAYTFSSYAQDAKQLHETAQGYLKEGDYQNAILVLNRALELEPNNTEILKEAVFANYLKRDFAKAIEIGKPLVDRPDADLRSFQLLGLAYKSIAEYKECEKMYKKGLKAFPNAGVLYSEYGEILAEKDVDNAIKLWEKGLEADANFSSNYYYVAKYYANNNELLWSILYSEIFLNLESYTKRSNEIKVLLLDQYKKFFATTDVPDNFFAKKTNAFTNNVARVLLKQQNQAILGITPETLTAIRTRFILEWFDKYADKYPFRLFDHQRQLLQEGHFEPYNQWLFGAATNNEAYQEWQKNHEDEMVGYLAYTRKRIFKIPSGQQYRTF